ncbi:hypothetical protein [Francisella sp. SYW-9]|uniref:hypothetical protein n=1 Tax=Francisella sp. SYW-9 TaxID=2610888 RepID=UPI00168D041E|nr:hypothetical protein [Francisella sp. SYW-9]
MKLSKILLISLISFVIFAQGYSLGNSYKSQMADMEKNYAEKTYGGELKIERINFGGL